MLNVTSATPSGRHPSSSSSTQRPNPELACASADGSHPSRPLLQHAADVRTSINTILMSVELLADEENCDAEERRHYLEFIRSAAETMQQFLDGQG